MEALSQYHCLNHTSLGVQVVSDEFRYLFLNTALLKEIGMRREEIVGKTMEEKFPGIQSTRVFQKIAHCLRTGESQNLLNEFVFNAKRRVFYHVLIEKVPEGVLIFTLDISESKRGEKLLQESNDILEAKVKLKTAELDAKNKALEEEIKSRRIIEKALVDANRQLELLAAVDELTGLQNRRGYEKSIETEIRRARRFETGLALVVLDVDYFKNMNDRSGHTIGDDALRAVGKVLNHACRRPDDHAFRVGGEEFAVLIANTDAQNAKQFAHNLCESISALGIENLGSHASDKLTVSVGVALYCTESALSPGQFYQIADRRLYLAKQNGRNRVCVED